MTALEILATLFVREIQHQYASADKSLNRRLDSELGHLSRMYELFEDPEFKLALDAVEKAVNKLQKELANKRKP